MNEGSTRFFARASLAVALVLAIGHRAEAQAKASAADQLAQQAEVIAVANVDQVHSEWNESRTMIRTRVTMSVDQFIKGGGNGNALTVYVPGGEVGDVGELYTHMPVFRNGEHVVVFAEKDPQGRYRVSGGAQGKYSIEKDPATGRNLVAGKSTLDEFTRAVRNAVKGQPSQ